MLLEGGVARQRSDDGDPVSAFGLLQVGHRGVTTVDQVLGGARAPAFRPGMNAGQDLGVGAGGRHGDHVRDHVGALAGAGLGQVREEPRQRFTCPRRA